MQLGRELTIGCRLGRSRVRSRPWCPGDEVTDSKRAESWRRRRMRIVKQAEHDEVHHLMRRRYRPASARDWYATSDEVTTELGRVSLPCRRSNSSSTRPHHLTDRTDNSNCSLSGEMMHAPLAIWHTDRGSSRCGSDEDFRISNRLVIGHSGPWVGWGDRPRVSTPQPCHRTVR